MSEVQSEDQPVVRRRRRRGRARSIPKGCSPVLRQLFAAVDAEFLGNMEEVAKRAGVAKDTVSQWRRGIYSPKLQNVEAVLDVLGYKLTIRTKSFDDQ